MPKTPYTYTYPGADFPSLVTPAPCGSTLASAIKYNPAITIALDEISIGIVPGDCVFTFADVLPAADKTALDAICAATTGTRVIVSMEASSSVAVDEVTVVSDASWQFIAEIVTTPSFFSEDLSALFGRIVGAYKATAGGGGELPQIKVLEKVAGQPDEDKISPPYDFAAAADWTTFGVSTDVPVRDGYHNVYCVLARLNGAASLEIRGTTMSVLLAKTVS